MPGVNWPAGNSAVSTWRQIICLKDHATSFRVQKEQRWGVGLETGEGDSYLCPASN